MFLRRTTGTIQHQRGRRVSPSLATIEVDNATIYKREQQQLNH